MSNSQSIYMWETFYMIIQRIESRIDLISKTTDLYYSQYFFLRKRRLFTSILPHYQIISEEVEMF